MVIPDRLTEALQYIKDSYLLWNTHLGSSRDFNMGLHELKRSVSERRAKQPKRRRLHILVELAINERWRHDVELTTDRAPTLPEMTAAVRHVVSTLKARRGAPSHEVLKHHVACLMALLYEATGKPITASRTLNSLYAPRLVGTMGQFLVQFFQDLDPSITQTKLANLVQALSRPGSPVEQGFRALCPAFGGGVDAATGMPVLGPGRRLEQIRFNNPIYCS